MTHTCSQLLAILITFLTSNPCIYSPPLRRYPKSRLPSISLYNLNNLREKIVRKSWTAFSITIRSSHDKSPALRTTYPIDPWSSTLGKTATHKFLGHLMTKDMRLDDRRMGGVLCFVCGGSSSYSPRSLCIVYLHYRPHQAIERVDSDLRLILIFST